VAHLHRWTLALRWSARRSASGRTDNLSIYIATAAPGRGRVKTCTEEKMATSVSRRAGFLTMPCTSRPLRDPNAVLTGKAKTIPHLTLAA
jgi:hypothetical protein